MSLDLAVTRHPLDDMYRATLNGEDIGVVIAVDTDERALGMAEEIVLDRALLRVTEPVPVRIVP